MAAFALPLAVIYECFRVPRRAMVELDQLVSLRYKYECPLWMVGLKLQAY